VEIWQEKKPHERVWTRRSCPPEWPEDIAVRRRYRQLLESKGPPYSQWEDVDEVLALEILKIDRGTYPDFVEMMIAELKAISVNPLDSKADELNHKVQTCYSHLIRARRNLDLACEDYDYLMAELRRRRPR
jgi:hypothetical protein